MKKIYSFFCCGLLLLPGSGIQAAQLVSPVTHHSFIAAGDSVSFTLQYQVNAPETVTEAGLGLRIHYDSDLLVPTQISLYPSASQPYSNLMEDIEDYDNDTLTDSYFIVSWVDFAAQWPGGNLLPLDLLELQLGVLNNLSVPTRIGFSASATAKNAEFHASPLSLCPKSAVTVSTSHHFFHEEQSGVTPRFIFGSDRTIPVACGDLAVNYTLSGSASSGDDFIPLPDTIIIPAGQQQTEWELDIINDDLVEVDEMLRLTLQSGQDYQIGGDAAATLMILSEDSESDLPVVSLSSEKQRVTESQGGSLLLFVRRSAADISQDLDVFFNLSGTATVDEDYFPFPESITLPAGKQSAFAVLLLKDDSAQEVTETLNVGIAASAYYQRGENSTLQLIIEDDELNRNTSLPAVQNPVSTVVQSNVRPAPAQAHQVPGSSQWMLILMALLLGRVATQHLRHKARGCAV